MRGSLVLVVLAVAGCKQVSPKLRPLSTGTFDRYEIVECKPVGHLVRLTGEIEERGEARSRERVETYRDRYLIKAIETFADVVGWSFDATCSQSKLILRVAPEKALGEALHKVGETLRANPTDIDVVIVPSP